MSRPDLLSELRESRPLAPSELREHVRRIAARAEPAERRRGFSWRRALVIAVPVAAAAAGAAILLPGGPSHPSSLSPTLRLATSPPAAAEHSLSPVTKTAAAPALAAGVGGAATSGGQRPALSVPGTSPNRVQRVGAELELRVPTTEAVSDGSKRAVAIARALGGYPSSLEVNASGRSGYAELVLRIPKQNLSRAVARLSSLGMIMGENVSLEDITAEVEASTHKLARLEARLAAWQAEPQTPATERQIVALSGEIAALRRGRSTTVKNASYATVSVEMTTRQAPAPVHHGKSHFHGLLIVFGWAGIGAVYALALGAPLALLLALVWLAVRTVRRRRVDALLSRP